jgi:hypothetical protein
MKRKGTGAWELGSGKWALGFGKDEMLDKTMF